MLCVDLEYLLVSLYVLVDEWWQETHPLTPKKAARQPWQSPAEWWVFEVDPRCLCAAVEGGDEFIIAGGVELCHGSLG